MSDKIKEMVEAHWSLIGVVVRSFLKQRKYSRFEPHKEDLMGVASIALVEAAERYDPNRLVLFRTYASARMRGKMQKEITKIVEKEHNEVYIADCGERDREEFSTPDFTKLLIDGDENDTGLIERLEPKDSFEREVYWRCIIGNEGVRSAGKALGSGHKRVTETKQALLKRFKGE
jgi:hypothetical protein